MFAEETGLPDLLGIIGGLSVIGAVAAWVAALVRRLILRRPVSFGEWVAHGAGAGGLAGILLVVVDWLL
jgi:hypothetical protein